MKNTDLINELSTLLSKDFKSDDNYDELKHDIIAEINSSSRSLDDQELEAITQKQYFESRTSLSDTSLCITYIGIVIPICLSTLSKSTSWSDIIILFVILLDLILAGVLIYTRIYQQKNTTPISNTIM